MLESRGPVGDQNKRGGVEFINRKYHQPSLIVVGNIRSRYISEGAALEQFARFGSKTFPRPLRITFSLHESVYDG